MESNDGGVIENLDERVTQIVAGFIVGGILTIAEVPIRIILILRGETLTVIDSLETPLIQIFDTVRVIPFVIIDVMETGASTLAVNGGVFAPLLVVLYWGGLVILLIWTTWQTLWLAWWLYRVIPIL